MTTSTVSASQNFLSPIRFVFQIDTPELENISYNCQSVTIPSITVPEIDVPFRAFHAKQSGSEIQFDNFEARFIIDENLENYTAIYNWMLSEVTTGGQERLKHKDVILLIYNNNNQSNIRIQMIDAMPVSLSPVEFTTTNSDTQYLVSDVSFTMDYYKIVSLRS